GRPAAHQADPADRQTLRGRCAQGLHGGRGGRAQEGAAPALRQHGRARTRTGETMAGLLEGHIAAVTGGGSGIGQGICQAYAREGARVVVLDSNPAGAQETVGLVTAAGGWASAVTLDVTDREACKAAAAEIARAG